MPSLPGGLATSAAVRRGVLVLVGLLLMGVVLVGIVGCPARPAGAAASTCTQDWRLAADPTYLTPDGQPTHPPAALPPPPNPDHRPFHVFCAGHYVSTVWVPTTLTTIGVARVARDLLSKAVYPSVRPGVNPTVGLTGLASWFWAEADTTPVRMLPGNGPGIELEVRVQTVRWRFGDGTTGSPSGFGAPFPSPSPVQHVFERTGTFTVDAHVVLAARLWYEELIVDLPAGGHTVELRHDVVQLRSLLHAR